MEDKKAIEVLIKLSKKPGLNKEEKEAILAAIGVLDIASLAKNRMKSIFKSRQAKRAKSLEWNL